MSDLIDREEVIKSVRDCKAWHFCDLIEVLSAIKAIPSARPKGEWIDNGHYLTCSECGIHVKMYWNFCPCCGTSMPTIRKPNAKPKDKPQTILEAVLERQTDEDRRKMKESIRKAIKDEQSGKE